MGAGQSEHTLEDLASDFDRFRMYQAEVVLTDDKVNVAHVRWLNEHTENRRSVLKEAALLDKRHVELFVGRERARALET